MHLAERRFKTATEGQPAARLGASLLRSRRAVAKLKISMPLLFQDPMSIPVSTGLTSRWKALLDEPEGEAGDDSSALSPGRRDDPIFSNRFSILDRVFSATGRNDFSFVSSD